ncbi:MAG TPA: MMPL family transporter, partial [Solirubrobacterales bacterium]|nr:MMPL family transporter [Solirubrobacterales bacterium]
MFDSLARLANERAKRVGLLAIVFFLLAGAIGGSVADRLDPYGADDADTETVQARERLQDAGLRVPAVLAVVEDAPVAKPATKLRVERLEAEVAARPDVASVSGYYDTGSRAFVSQDGQSTYFAVALKATEDKELQEAGEEIADQLSANPGVVVGGFAVAQQQVNEQVEEDLKKAEMIAFPLLFLLSLLFFRSLVASVLPLMIGGLAIVGTFLILRVASEVGSISIFALNLTTALGLGLAIDYSLFIVSRYREEIAKSGPGLEAMRRVLATAGRTVFFSSLTVSAALASLLVFPQRFLYSMGLGGSLVALFAALISLTVLPAVLTLLGSRVNAGAPKFLQRRAEADAKPAQEGFWYRLSRFVMRRPLPVATLSALSLIVLGLPFLGIRFNVVDPTVLPESASARQAYDKVSREFPPYHDTPIWIDVESEDPLAARQVAAAVRRVPGVAEVAQPQPLAPGVSAVQAISSNPFASEASKETVREIRDLPEPAGATVLVGGASADFLDFQGSLSDHLPYALAIVIVSTLVILFLM